MLNLYYIFAENAVAYVLRLVLWKFPKQVFCAVKLVGGGAARLGGGGVGARFERARAARRGVVREEMSNEWEEALQIEHEWGTGISSLLHSNEEIEILHQTWHIGRMLLEYSEHRLAGLVCVCMYVLPCLLFTILYY